MASINFVLSNRKIKDFSTWAEFERENWDTVNEKIDAITIIWDISLKLPQYQLPQRHSMKVRIGNAIPSKDMFQLVFTSDDISELIEMGSPGVCKVDFVNSIIALELLNIVSNWYDGLEGIPEPVFLQRFFKRYGKLLSEVVRYSLPILLLIIAHLYSNYIYPFLGIHQEVSLDTIQRLLIFLTALFMVGIFIGFKVENSIDRSINKFEVYPGFLITRGDKKAVEGFEANSTKITNQIGGKLLQILLSFAVTSGLRFVIGHFK
jgi:hypothetical protein